MKSEPNTFSVDDLARAPRKTTHWDGVRNYRARNILRDEMRRGDLAFFYHSNCVQPGVAGIMKVVKAGYPDHTAFDPSDPHFDSDSDPAKPRWYMVDVQLQRKLRRVITLEELKKHRAGALESLTVLQRGNRLSITPVSEAHWKFIVALE